MAEPSGGDSSRSIPNEAISRMRTPFSAEGEKTGVFFFPHSALTTARDCVIIAAMIHLKRLYANNFKQLQEIELHFPDRARVLVQGKNEAGKSTLFEAVFFGLFGAAIATEGSAKNLDTLIAYEKEKARVELDVASGGRLFKITRTIIRDKPNQWQLDIQRDGASEEIRGNTVVNKRLVDELGFDGEALLNTCFVEQKKLEKLEGMSKPKREESLAKLLNLDALVDLESDLKIRAEDKQTLERLRKRAELADAQFQLPTRQEELATVESKLALIDLRGAVQGAVNELRVVEQLDVEIRALAAKRDAAAERVERMNRLREAMLSVKDARDALERAEESAREIQRLQMEFADANRAALDAPNLQSRAIGLRRALRLAQRLGQVRAAGDAAQQRVGALSANAERINELSASVARDEETVAQLETRVREFEVGEALGEWIGAQEAKDAQGRASSVEGRRVARDKIARRLRLEVYGLAALLFVALVIGIGLQSLVSSLFALTLLVVLAFRASILWRDLARASEEVGRAEGEAHARGESSEEQAARLKEAEERLGQLGAAIPETIAVAQSRRVLIARETENKAKAELRAEYDTVRERTLNARAVLGELTREDVERERRTSARKTRKAGELLARWQARVAANAQTLGVEADASAIQRAVFQLDAQVEQIARRARDAARLKEEIARKEEQTRGLWTRARESYEQARAMTANARAWNPSLTLDDYTAFGKELRAEYDALGGEAALKEAREIENEVGRKQGEKETRAKNAAVLEEQIRGLVEATGRRAPAKMHLRELEELGKNLAALDLGNEAELRGQHRELVGRVRSLEDQKAQFEKELGLENEALDRAQCRGEYEQAARQLQVRERGAEIVQIARRRVMQKVLPATMDYMRRILPSLTRDRYHDAQLDEESYKIQVWDERAGNGGAFKEKNIFSGGTRDQFSLALRLAFALATLPQERGSAPSFIFLDEPLGSFDSERADALIYLLTEGEIARAFDQIFLISHVHVDERLFTNRVVMENGKVAFTDLK